LDFDAFHRQALGDCAHFVVGRLRDLLERACAEGEGIGTVDARLAQNFSSLDDHLRILDRCRNRQRFVGRCLDDAGDAGFAIAVEDGAVLGFGDLLRRLDDLLEIDVEPAFPFHGLGPVAPSSFSQQNTDDLPAT